MSTKAWFCMYCCTTLLPKNTICSKSAKNLIRQDFLTVYKLKHQNKPCNIVNAKLNIREKLSAVSR